MLDQMVQKNIFFITACACFLMLVSLERVSEHALCLNIDASCRLRIYTGLYTGLEDCLSILCCMDPHGSWYRI